MAEFNLLQWTIILILIAVILSLIVLVQIISSYTAAYQAAPLEIATFLDTADFSVQENESYDRDVAKVQRLDDKIRLTRLLREIQKTGDDLREDINGVVIEEDTTKLKTSARLLWASKRSRLEDRVRRLDMLRMRFLVVYMGVVASQTSTTIHEKPSAPPPPPPLHTARDLEKSPVFRTPTRPALPRGLMEGIISRPPLRSLTTQALVNHPEPIPKPSRKGWAGVVQELQTSPKMHQRHASIERAMSRSYSKSP
jgi:cell division protein FtsL